MKKQIELRAAMVRAGMGYKELARACRVRGVEVEATELSAIAGGRREASEKLITTVAAVLGRPTYEVFT
ncbi:MAG: hypothetical protein NTY53_25340 [Kiritimatiellaeota bacterium]|nr:hypothetical protein [Kiritimatiellota bacterium]